MRGNDKLAAEKPRTVFQKFQQLLLFFRRQAVFRLVEQIERMLPYLLFKIQKCAFPIGMFPDIISQAVSDILGLWLSAGHVHLFQLLIIFHWLQPEGTVFHICIILCHLSPPPVDSFIQMPYIQHKFKHIIARNHAAALRNLPAAFQWAVL